MAPGGSKDPLFAAALLKLSFIQKGMVEDPGFRVVYFGTLEELGLSDTNVTEYINQNRQILESRIREGKTAY